jgi:hypothetical protein
MKSNICGTTFVHTLYNKADIEIIFNFFIKCVMLCNKRNAWLYTLIPRGGATLWLGGPPQKKKKLKKKRKNIIFTPILLQICSFGLPNYFFSIWPPQSLKPGSAPAYPTHISPLSTWTNNVVKKRFDYCTTPIQQLYNNPSHEGLLYNCCISVVNLTFSC